VDRTHCRRSPLGQGWAAGRAHSSEAVSPHRACGEGRPWRNGRRRRRSRRRHSHSHSRSRRRHSRSRIHHRTRPNRACASGRLLLLLLLLLRLLLLLANPAARVETWCAPARGRSRSRPPRRLLLLRKWQSLPCRSNTRSQRRACPAHTGGPRSMDCAAPPPGAAHRAASRRPPGRAWRRQIRRRCGSSCSPLLLRPLLPFRSSRRPTTSCSTATGPCLCGPMRPPHHGHCRLGGHRRSPHSLRSAPTCAPHRRPDRKPSRRETARRETARRPRPLPSSRPLLLRPLPCWSEASCGFVVVTLAAAWRGGGASAAGTIAAASGRSIVPSASRARAR
jgi:hypothetical protein